MPMSIMENIHRVSNTCQMIRFRWILKLQIWKQSSKIRGSDVAARVYPQQARSLEIAYCFLLHTQSYQSWAQLIQAYHSACLRL